MASVRLYPDQIERLRSKANSAAVIRSAVQRWRKGKIVIGAAARREKGQNILQVFPIWKKVNGVSDELLRQILDAHFVTPNKELEAEIAWWDKIIAEEMALIPKEPFIIIEEE